MTTKDELLTPDEVKEELKFKNVESVHRLLRRGKIPFIFFNKKTLRIRRSALDRYIKTTEGK